MNQSFPNGDCMMHDVELLLKALRIASETELDAYLRSVTRDNPGRLAQLKQQLTLLEELRGDAAKLDDDDLRWRIEAKLSPSKLSLDAAQKSPPDEVTRTSAYANADHPASETEDFTSAGTGSVTIAGRYVLERKIGEGGMGEVWNAKQIEPVKRRVALKLIKKGMDSRAVLHRFEQERQALAMMDHPNIARVLDAGVTDQGQPFFVMELVNGLPLTKFADQAKLTTDQRLQLFVPICNAVQHAHQKGIVHRDLKPANILVTMIDGTPVPKVIDFGVAKATGGNLTDDYLTTQFGAIIGTLEYMSPEQAGYSGGDIDTRADIYSLGVVLYELLTGLRPIDREQLKVAGLAEIIRVITEEEPSRPSTRLSTCDSLPSLAAARGIEPKKLTSLLRGDLDCVVMKCLEKSRERRYETANGLARDIQRFLANELVEARPPSQSYRLIKFLRRNRGHVIAASLVAVALLCGLIGTTLGLWKAQRQEALAREATVEKDKALQQEARQAELERAARRNAQAMTKNALDTSNTVVFEIQQELQNQPGMQALRIKLLNKARSGLEKILEQARDLGTPDHSIVSSHYQLGNLEWNLGNMVAAQKEFQSGLEIAKALVEAQPKNASALRDVSTGYTNVGDSALQAGNTSLALEKYQQAQKFDQALVDLDPQDAAAKRSLSIDIAKIGDVTLRQGNSKAALALYEQVLELRKPLAQVASASIQSKRDLIGAYTRLGDAKLKLGEVEDALIHFKTAMGNSQLLADAQSGNSSLQRDLGINIKRVANVMQRIGQTDDALVYYEKATKVLKALVDADPRNAEVQRDLGGCYERLGDTMLQMGKTHDALGYYKSSLEISQTLAKMDAGNAEAVRDLSVNTEKLGDVLMAVGQPNDALPYYQTALDISRTLAVADPKNFQAQSDVGFGHLKIAEVMTMLRKHREALDSHQLALKIRETQAAEVEDDAQAQTDLYRSYCLLGEASIEAEEYSNAAQWLSQAQAKLVSMQAKGWYTKSEEILGQEKVSEVQSKLKDQLEVCEQAGSAIADIEFAVKQRPALVAHLVRVQVLDSIKHKRFERASECIERFVSWIELQSQNQQLNRYHAARLYSLYAAADEPNRVNSVAQLMTLLKKVATSDFFTPMTIAQIKREMDFEWLRHNNDFVAFTDSLRPNQTP